MMLIMLYLCVHIHTDSNTYTKYLSSKRKEAELRLVQNLKNIIGQNN